MFPGDALKEDGSRYGNKSDFMVTAVAYVPAGDVHLLESTEITITASASFGDVVDGSEDHFILVQVPADWDASAATVTGADAVDGVSVITVDAANASDYPGVTYGTYLKVAVDDQLDAGDNDASVEVTFTPPNVETDTTYTSATYGMAVESNTSDTEITTDNNVAITAGDVVSIDLTDSEPVVVSTSSYNFV